MQSAIHKILDINFLTESIYLFRAEKQAVTFKAGQCFSLAPVGLGINREYSIYSGENDTYLEFLIKIVEGGIVTSALKKSKIGDSLEIAGPYGEFCLDKKKVASSKYLFIATGTGIAPFNSFIKTFPQLDYQIIHGIRYDKEKYPEEDNKYTACVSREKTTKHFKGRLTDYLTQIEIPSDTICYLCGNRAMIIDAYDILRQQDINGDNIITEVFF